MNHSSQPNGEDLTAMSGYVVKVSAIIVIILMSVLGNLLVIVSVLLNRRLRVVGNYFVVSLALADMLVALCAMTFNASIQIAGRWLFSFTMCNVWNSFDVFFSTVSILHLCCISVDRYIAVRRPLKYRTVMSKRRVALLLVACWTAPLAISFVPICLGWYTSQQHLEYHRRHPHTCEFVVNRVYMLVSSSISFWIPGVVMVCMYSLVYREARRQHQAITSAVVGGSYYPTAVGENGSSLGDIHEDPAAAIPMSEMANSTGNWHEGPGSGETSVVGHNQRSRASVAHPAHTPRLSRVLPKMMSVVSFLADHTGSSDAHRKSSTISRMERLRYSTSQMLREHKAAKTLGIIMGCFLLCWLPFFSWYTIATLCGTACEVPSALVDTLFWIGYFNSALNPLIYAYFNTEFRQAFYHTLVLVFCHCSGCSTCCEVTSDARNVFNQA